MYYKMFIDVFPALLLYRRLVVKIMTLKITWTVSKAKDDSRASAMYCFKNCSANQN